MSESTRISVPGYDGLFHTDQLDHLYTPKVDEWCGEDSSPSYCFAWVASAEGLKMRCGRPREMHHVFVSEGR